MLIGIIGNIGSGKSLLNRVLMEFSERDILANFNVSEVERYKRLELLDLLNLKDNVDIFIDEGYTWLESRTSLKKVNRFISYIILQSRKRQIDIYITVQLFGSIDLRFRENCDIIIVCQALKNKKKQLLGFNYRILEKRYNGFYLRNSLFLSYDTAKLFFNLYDTYEIIQPADYLNLQLDILKDNVSELKQKLDELIEPIYQMLVNDNKKITKVNILAYLSLFKISKDFHKYMVNKISERVV